MDYLKQLATVEDITEELSKVVAEEEKLNRLILFNLTGNQEYYDLSNSVDVVKSSAVEYNRIAKDLCTVGKNVNEITKEIEEISKEMRSCSSDAVTASKNIKHYSTLKENTGKALELVSAMIDLNRSVAGIEHSLQNEEYEKATEYILKYRHAILTGDISNNDETIMEKSTNTLLNALIDQLTNSIERNKPVQIYRYCSLLDSLGEGRSALSKIVPYLINPLAEQASKDLSLLKNQHSSVNIGVLIGNQLGSLFKHAVDLIEEVESQFTNAFTQESFGFCYFIRSVFVLCDKQCNEILSYYIKIRDLKVVSDNTKQILQQYVSAEDGKENKHFETVNQILNEISLFLQHRESFTRYFLGKANDCYALALQVPHAVELQDYHSCLVIPIEIVNDLTSIQQKRVIPQGNQQVSFKTLQQCSQFYNTLEECFALYSLNRSIFNCMIDMESNITTVPEEAFYLFEIIITRAISQGNIRNITTILAVVKGLVEQYLHAFILSLIRGRKTLPAPAGNLSLPKDQFCMVVLTNDISICIEYLNKLNVRIIQSVMEVFPQVPSTIRKNVDDLTNSSLLLFKNSFELQMRKIKDSVIIPLGQKIEKKIITTNFSLSNDIQSEQTADDVLSSILTMIKHTLLPYKDYILEDTFSILCNELSMQLSNRLENSLAKLKYTQQGVLVLDKILRGISNELINYGGSEIRTNFSKLNRFIAVLSCDDISSAMTLILNDKEDLSKEQVTSILHLRTDLQY